MITLSEPALCTRVQKASDSPAIPGTIRHHFNELTKDKRKACVVRCCPCGIGWACCKEETASARPSLRDTSSSRVRGGCERDLLTVVRPSVPVPEQLRRAPSPGCTAGLGGLGQVRTAPTEGSLAAYWRTRIPAVSSKRSTLSDLGNGASSTSPTLTPYFQSGGQMAMKRA
jgi:hypothetical protein